MVHTYFMEYFGYSMDGEIIFHMVHTNFKDCRLFTNSLLENKFGSRVVWVLHGWWNHFPYIIYLFHGLQIIEKFITWKKIGSRVVWVLHGWWNHFPYITYPFYGPQIIYKFTTWKKNWIKSSLRLWNHFPCIMYP